MNVEREMFKDRFIIVDGGILKLKPWQPLALIEKKLFPNEQNIFFSQNRFHKRSDGYYCLVQDIGKFRFYIVGSLYNAPSI